MSETEFREVKGHFGQRLISFERVSLSLMNILFVVSAFEGSD